MRADRCVERVVIDTNVLISAALSSRSLPARVSRLLMAHSRLLFSRETYAELEERLWRPKFDRYIDAATRRHLLAELSSVALWVELEGYPCVSYCRDPDDDVFVRVSLAGRAAWLISGDRDLLEMSSVPNLEVMSPSQAMERLKEVGVC